MNKIKGIVKLKTKVTTYSEKFKKAELIIETEDKYPQTLCVEFINESISCIEDININDKVEVSINIRGRKWTSPQNEDKYFTSLSGWQVSNIIAEKGLEQLATEDLTQDVDDDLPF
tara:strand:+ start:806 stop:1153 length:348 start_codon:yes stop_codon:yes gene_type:complete